MKLTAEQAEDLPFPVGCPVWYNFPSRSGGDGAAGPPPPMRRGTVRSVGLDFVSKALTYEVGWGGSAEEVPEGRLAYASGCPVSIAVAGGGGGGSVEGTILLPEPSPGAPGRFVYAAMTSVEGGRFALASGIGGERVAYRRAEDGEAGDAGGIGADIVVGEPADGDGDAARVSVSVSGARQGDVSVPGVRRGEARTEAADPGGRREEVRDEAPCLGPPGEVRHEAAVPASITCNAAAKRGSRNNDEGTQGGMKKKMRAQTAVAKNVLPNKSSNDSHKNYAQGRMGENMQMETVTNSNEIQIKDNNNFHNNHGQGRMSEKMQTETVARSNVTQNKANNNFHFTQNKAKNNFHDHHGRVRTDQIIQEDAAVGSNVVQKRGNDNFHKNCALIKVPLWLQPDVNAQRKLFYHLIGTRGIKRGVQDIADETNCRVVVNFDRDRPRLAPPAAPITISVDARSRSSSSRDLHAARDAIEGLLLDYLGLINDYGAKGRLVHELASGCTGDHRPTGSTSGAVLVRNPFDKGRCEYVSLVELADGGMGLRSPAFLLDPSVLAGIRRCDCFFTLCADGFKIGVKNCGPYMLVRGTRWQSVDQGVKVVRATIREHIGRRPYGGPFAGGRGS